MNQDKTKITPDICRPIAFWSLNHELNEEELAWQIEQMAQKGLGGFIMHPRSGLLIPYMSERWLDLIEFAVKEAEKYGMAAWLYDEDPYPSGIAGGQVIADHPEYRAQSLCVSEKKIIGPALLEMDVPLEKVVFAQAVRLEGGEIVERIDIRNQAGLLRTDWKRQRQYNTYYPTTYSEAIPQYRSDAYHPHYHLKWEAPAGEWKAVVCYTKVCDDYWLFPSYTDLLNPDAVRYFMNLTYEPYKKRLGKYFGTVIPGIFVDEPKFWANPFPWTGRMPAEFVKRKGYEIWDAILAMQLDTKDCLRKRKDFWEVAQDLFIEAFPKQISKWCEENHLCLIGHCSPEEEPADQVLMTGSIMEFMKQMQIPGTDLITMMIGDVYHPIVNMGPLLASSAAQQWRDGLALCESFGVMEWQLKLSDMVRVANWLAVLGVNGVIPHTFIYSIDGYRKMDAAPSEFYQSPYYRDFDAFSDYLARIGGILTKGETMAPTALLYPIQSLMALQPAERDRALLLRDELTALMDTLLRHHIPFEFVNDRDLICAEVGQGYIQVGKRKYQNCIIPPLAYEMENLEGKIRGLLQNGVRMIAVSSNNFPLLPCLQECRQIRLLGNAEDGFSFEKWEMVEVLCGGPLVLEGTQVQHLLTRHIRHNGRDTFFIFNTAETSICFQASFREVLSSHRVQKFNGFSGIAEDLFAQNGKYPLQLAPGEAVFLAVDAANSEIVTTPVPLWKGRQIELSSWWQFIPDRPNCLCLNRWTVTQRGEPGQVDFAREPHVVAPCPAGEAGIRNFPTDVYYKTVVRLRGDIQDLALVRERMYASGQNEVWVNGMLINNWESVRVYDCNNQKAALKSYIQKSDYRFYRRDELTICVKVRAERPEDGLLQPMHLIGGFTVKLNNHESVGAWLQATEYPHEICTGTWTAQGYPHFAGCGKYVQTFIMENEDIRKNWRLHLNIGGHSAEVSVNGKRVGKCIAAPYTLPLTDCLRAGENTIEISVANTLEGLLYGLDSASGIIEPVSLEEY